MATTLERRSTSRLRGLRCRACHVLQPADERYVCGECYGPIEPEYDLAAFDTESLRAEIERGPLSLWRYAPLLPVAAPRGHFAVGWTPLVEAPRLGAAIGVARLFLKDDSRNPSLSFKDRPVAVALARALELGLDTIACASTGKVAGAAAYGATVVRVNGTYDQVNRLCARLADEERWGFVNFTLRPYYAEGSKTLLFESAEQLGWCLPDHVVVPVGSGALLTRTATAAAQLRGTGLAEGALRIHAAQPSGCAPVSDAVLEGYRAVRPVRDPVTVARSLAIGAPADGDGSVEIIRASGGSAGSVSDDEVLEGCALLASSEGVLAEPAGGVVVATARALAARGAFADDESVVLYITGNGYKGTVAANSLLPAIVADADEFRATYTEVLA